MSSKAEDFMRRCVQSATYSARARDPMVAEFYKRMAIRWFRRAVEERGKIRLEQIGYPIRDQSHGRGPEVSSSVGAKYRPTKTPNVERSWDYT
jgi:hypothetical protein